MATVLSEIPYIISLEEFEEKFKNHSNNATLDIDIYLQKCMDFLSNSSFETKKENISENLPSYIDYDSGFIRVSIPTYKITIKFEKTYTEFDNFFNTLKKYIGKHTLIFSKYNMTNNATFYPELIFNNNTFKENLDNKNIICSLLDKKNIAYEFIPSFSHNHVKRINFNEKYVSTEQNIDKTDK